MRKANLSLIVTCLIGTFVFFNSCKREFSPDTSSNNATISKVNAWLDEQKQGKLPNKAAKLDLLRTNLNFSNLHFEKSDNGEQFLIVPINEKFKDTAKIDKNTIVNLLLIINKSGDIRGGNVVLYTAPTGQVNKIPENTFYNIFNTAQPECNGGFQFLTVTGTPQYQLEYKDKHLITSGLYQAKGSTQSNSLTKMAPIVCTDWYLVTTYYNMDGSPITVTSTYLYTTCADACSSPNYVSLCTDDGATGGGGGSVVVSSCVNDALKQFQQEVDGAKTTSILLDNHISTIDPFTKHKDPVWTILTGAGGWHLNSQEIGIIKLINVTTNTWAWVSLTHSEITKVGSTLPTTSITFSKGVGTPSFTPEVAKNSNIFYAGMSLNYSITYHLVCNCPDIPLIGWYPDNTISYTSGAIWDAKPL